MQDKGETPDYQGIILKEFVIKETKMNHEPPMCFWRTERYEGKNAGIGSSGDNAPDPIGNDHGELGSVVVLSTDNSYESYAPYLTPLAAKLFLRQAIVSHVNNNHKEAAERLIWLQLLLEPDMPHMSNYSNFSAANRHPITIGPVPNYEFDNIKDQVRIQIKRLSMGLDAYGNSPSFVPMLTYKAYDDYIKRWIESALRAESLFSSFYSANKEQKEAISYVNETIQSLDALVVNLKDDILSIEKSRMDIQDDILRLFSEAQRALSKLILSSNAFQDAVSREAGCDFGNVLKATAAIVAISQGGAGAIAAAGPLLDAINSDEKDNFKYLNLISEKMSIVYGNLQSISDAYGKIKDLITSTQNNNITLPNDKAKILVQREQIVELVERFRNIPSAQDYLKDFDAYVEVVLARNAKIVECDVLALRVAEYQSKIKQAMLDKSDISKKISENFQPDLPEYQEFMERNLDMHKTELLRSLYYARRALIYLTLDKQIDIDFNRSTVSHIEQVYHILDRSLINAYENRGRTYQTVELGNSLGKFSIKKLAGEDAIIELKNRKNIIFSIPSSRNNDPFPYFYHVFATKARVNFVGFSREQALSLRLIHCGHAKFFDVNGNIREFEHLSRTTIVDSFESNGTTLGQNDLFIPLSPYGPWQVDILQYKNMDLSRLEDIEIEFELMYLPRSKYY